MSPPLLSEIYIYPVKSFSGVKVDTWEVDKKGLRYDRKWMVVDGKNQFLTQRKLPRMALIKPSLNDTFLVLTAPSMSEISIPLNQNSGEKIETTIWTDHCPANLVSKEVDQWLSEFLQTDCRLVYQGDETIRPVDPDYANPNDHITFTDGFPFLIISENSMAALNREMELDLPITRFRPNLVISGCNSYAEDFWRNISIGALNFRLPKPCSRCSIPTINIETAKFNKEPLRTLNRLRKWNKNVYFGQNALHDNEGILNVGDTVTIHKTGIAQPPI